MAKGKYQDWLTDEGLLKLEAWARNGLTDEQIASNIGISRSTLNEWKKKHSDISDTLKRGKEVIDIQVENALLKRALGYEYTECTKERMFDAETGEFKLITTKEVTKEVAGDTTAQIFWLKNRKPDVWRDRRDIAVEGSLNTTSSMTDEELSDRIKRLKEKLGLDGNEQS
ncbi:helix-turn-helix domain-containing protein [Paenibacillus lentus]|uniref:Helix-turn-helix domain-containing protein n=1 Tax=Paenibacillus lentus TaxID=1338368 RepID=A0A3S8RP52_9BACL|nr:helix-turn-helix domain-containing protein [Paenibacillus lentus]AZK44785.1 helix-turn-helix domain-containing protein [Paenibacillus lentus]